MARVENEVLVNRWRLRLCSPLSRLCAIGFALVMLAPVVVVQAAADTTTIATAGSPRRIVEAGSKTYVLGEAAITVISTTTNAVITTITPTAVASSTINEGVYIASDQSLWVSRYVNANPGGDVFRIDTTTDTVTHYFTSQAGKSVSGASGITATATKIYVAMNGSDKVAVFDIASTTQENDLAYPGTTSDTNSPSTLCTAGGTLYIFQGSSAHVTPWTLSTGTQGAALATGLGGGAGYCALNPAGTTIYFGNGTAIRSINVSSNTIAAVTTSYSGISGIEFNSGGSQLFVAASPNLVVLNPTDNSLLDSVSSGTNPNGFALVNSDGSALISQRTASSVRQISLSPSVTTSNASLTINTSSSIAAPTATGFWTNPTYSSTSLPAGLTLNTSTGAITGTPTVAQPATNVTITATGGIFTRQSTFTITVTDPSAPSSSVAPVVVGPETTTTTSSTLATTTTTDAGEVEEEVAALPETGGNTSVLLSAVLLVGAGAIVLARWRVVGRLSGE